MRFLLALLMLLLPLPAYANGGGEGQCDLCSLDPAVLTSLIQACQTQPGGAACEVLRSLAGLPGLEG